jgi:hypothetical protein
MKGRSSLEYGLKLNDSRLKDVIKGRDTLTYTRNTRRGYGLGNQRLGTQTVDDVSEAVTAEVTMTTRSRRGV